jgi:hypothetical protein
MIYRIAFVHLENPVILSKDLNSSHVSFADIKIR